MSTVIEEVDWKDESLSWLARRDELVARNQFGSRLGHFDKRTNSTRDRHGNKIGEGNTTASLVVDAWKQQ